MLQHSLGSWAVWRQENRGGGVASEGPATFQRSLWGNVSSSIVSTTDLAITALFAYPAAMITNRSIGYITQYFRSILVRVMWAQREELSTTATLTLVAIVSLDKFLKFQYLLKLKTQRLIAFIGSERKDHIQGFLQATPIPELYMQLGAQSGI